ncbi:MAG: Stk1 family PASTA domain-containing Ser/Thr kinase [Clostridiaceae bacterium]|nr:Stk1 family PASTA domain-containing Ser/Thr kinase [Clostridiaceae bacterium]
MLGRTLGGRFKIRELIGSGGMAQVYLADDLETGVQVAVKALKSEFLDDEEFVHRFDTEARAAASLAHPNIVKVYGVGEEEDVRYMVQQYISGTTLKDLIDKYGHLDWHVAVPIAIQVTRALEHAHRNGIIHRDIKPQNIMVTSDYRALVTDFGIARASTSSTITISNGNALGSVHYFSPEQARGGIVSEKSDIYSLGILLYEMLTGRLPFDGDTTVAVAIMHLQEMPLPPDRYVPTIPPGLAAIVMKCIRKQPDRRYPNATLLAEELQAFLRYPEGMYGLDPDFAGTAERPGTVPKHDDVESVDRIHALEQSIRVRRRNRRRERGLIAAIVVICVAIVALLATLLWQKIGSGITPPVTGVKVVLDNYQGRPWPDVEAIMKRERIPYETELVDSNDREGIVLAQDPQPSTELERSDMLTVRFKVSRGSGIIELPNYIDQPFLQAMMRLEEMGLIPERRDEFHETIKQGNIIAMEPEPGTTINRNSKVVLVVSSGPERTTVPWILRLNRAQALKSMEEKKLIAVIELSDDALDLPESEQYVIGVSPETGEELPVNSEVKVRFGSVYEAFPDFTTPPTTTEEPTTEEPTTEEPTTEEPTTEEPTTKEPTTEETTEAPTDEPTEPTTTEPLSTTTATPTTTVTPTSTEPTEPPETTAEPEGE